jgi:hypothetical protein
MVVSCSENANQKMDLFFSVALHWNNLGVLMVGPYGDWLRFPCKDNKGVFLIPEVDCCWVLTDSSVETLQRVPLSTALLLRIGSIEPSAMLLDASDAFDSGSLASEEATRAIVKTGALMEAIETCAKAATKEHDIATQKRLWGAALHGMHFPHKENDERSCVMVGSEWSQAIMHNNKNLSQQQESCEF